MPIVMEFHIFQVKLVSNRRYQRENKRVLILVLFAERPLTTPANLAEFTI